MSDLIEEQAKVDEHFKQDIVAGADENLINKNLPQRFIIGHANGENLLTIFVGLFSLIAGPMRRFLEKIFEENSGFRKV